MKLELKHLAPYLPYGLKGVVICELEKSIDILESMSFLPDELICLQDSGDWYFNNELNNSSFKPILRPLSDLMKKINIKGEFIPAELLFPIDNKELEEYEIYGAIPEYWTVCISQIKGGYLDYKTMEYLFKWHFDVFGLIDSGLAIDLNTLK